MFLSNAQHIFATLSIIPSLSEGVWSASGNIMPGAELSVNEHKLTENVYWSDLRVPWVLVTKVLPRLRMMNMAGALTSYQSFLEKGSTLHESNKDSPLVCTNNLKPKQHKVGALQWDSKLQGWIASRLSTHYKGRWYSYQASLSFRFICLVYQCHWLFHQLHDAIQASG